MNNNQIIAYFKHLRKLRNYLGVDFNVQCNEWLNLYLLLGDNPSFWGDEDLPILLALVHPDFHYDRRGVNIGEHFEHPHSRRSFPKSKRIVSHCGISDLIEDALCPYWRGEKLASDHLWPHSLGGATSTDNRLALCGTCNQQKSSSPLLYPGHWVPGWLRNRVQIMKRYKERIWE